MKKLLRIAALAAFAVVCVQAQNLTTVSASNITDAAGNKLAAGQICLLGTDQNNLPINYQVGGGGQVLKRAVCAAVTAGAIAGGFNVPNPANTSPKGVLYRTTVTDSSTGQIVLQYVGVAFSGGTFNLDNYQPSGILVPPPPTPASVTGPLNVSGDVTATGGGSFGSLTATSPAITSDAIEGMYYADLSVGATPALKITATGVKCGGTNCIIVAPPSLGAGTPNALPDVFLDLRNGLNVSNGSFSVGGVGSYPALGANPGGGLQGSASLNSDGGYQKFVDNGQPIYVQGGGGPCYAGTESAWSSGTTYNTGNAVSYSGSYYYSIQDGNINHTPGGANTPTWWGGPLVACGTDGTNAFRRIGSSVFSLPDLTQQTTGSQGGFLLGAKGGAMVPGDCSTFSDAWGVIQDSGLSCNQNLGFKALTHGINWTDGTNNLFMFVNATPAGNVSLKINPIGGTMGIVEGAPPTFDLLFADSTVGGLVDSGVAANSGNITLSSELKSLRWTSNGHTGSLLPVGLSADQNWKPPDASGTFTLTSQLGGKATLTTTAATTDAATVTWSDGGTRTPTSCTFSPTNSTGAADITHDFISAYGSNSVTLTHTAAASFTYTFVCTAN